MQRALLLDLDGTLADSLQLVRQCYFSYLQRFGATGSMEEFQSLNGPPLALVVAKLKQAHALPGSQSELLNSYRQEIALQYRQVQPMAGALTLVTQAHEKGWSIGVVTSNQRSIIQPWLARHQIWPMVATLVCGEDVQHGKPHPEPYLTALGQLHCEASQSLAVEDSPQGASAATAAGVATWGVGFSTDAPPDGWPPVAGFIPGLEALLPWL
uniref:Putative inorganic diphosphatase n=1 Tax=Magnetococcus massalia (strain MO-1) TaxID=451514 RepID=A0A1S7LJ98_MAGMO|nr:Putative inorganic diphosphatase [Candidatus Magnetococcus massalia]